MASRLPWPAACSPVSPACQWRGRGVAFIVVEYRRHQSTRLFVNIPQLITLFAHDTTFVLLAALRSKTSVAYNNKRHVYYYYRLMSNDTDKYTGKVFLSHDTPADFTPFFMFAFLKGIIAFRQKLVVFRLKCPEKSEIFY